VWTEYDKLLGDNIRMRTEIFECRKKLLRETYDLISKEFKKEDKHGHFGFAKVLQSLSSEYHTLHRVVAHVRSMVDKVMHRLLTGKGGTVADADSPILENMAAELEAEAKAGKKTGIEWAEVGEIFKTLLQKMDTETEKSLRKLQKEFTTLEDDSLEKDLDGSHPSEAAVKSALGKRGAARLATAEALLHSPLLRTRQTPMPKNSKAKTRRVLGKGPPESSHLLHPH